MGRLKRYFMSGFIGTFASSFQGIFVVISFVVLPADSLVVLLTVVQAVMQAACRWFQE